MTALLENVAIEYLKGYLSLIPIKASGEKRPDAALLPNGKWEPYQDRTPTTAEVRRWYGNGTPRGIALVCGKISQSLEVLDFDKPGIYEVWRDLVQAAGLSDLEKTLPLEATPKGGRHIFYRCEKIAGNKALARYNAGTPEKPEPRALIETRGEGGYIIVAPTPAECHPLNKPYISIRRPLPNIPTITPEQREVLHQCARSLNEYSMPERVHVNTTTFSPNSGTRPGDDYNRKATWREVLEPHGWQLVMQRGDVGYWKRPGTTDSKWSATTGYGGIDMMYIFSSSCWPLENEHSYDKFGVYARLNHNGDMDAAGKELAARGYGSSPFQSTVAGSSPGQNGAASGGAETKPFKVSTYADAEILLPQTRWLWHPYLPCRYLTLVAADSGVGKSAWLLLLIKHVLLGIPFPGESDAAKTDYVLLCDTEVFQPENIKRMTAMHIPREKVLAPLEDPLEAFQLDNKEHLERFQKVAELYKPGLIIIDSLSGAHNQDEISLELGRVLKNLASVVMHLDYQPCIIISHHLNAGLPEQAALPITMRRIRGHTSVKQYCRQILGIHTPDLNDKNAKRVHIVKANLVPEADVRPLGFRWVNDTLEWCEPPAVKEATPPPTHEKQADRVIRFLRHVLADGPRLAEEVLKEAELDGFSEWTVRRALERADVTSYKEGKHAKYFWKIQGVDEVNNDDE